MDIRNVDLIYIEPMNENNEEFIGKNYLEVQKDYFAKDLVKEYNCNYYFEERSISKDNNDYDKLVLFQMNSKIIASAIMNTVIPFTPEYKLNHPEYKDNNGYYSLLEDSIKIFEPINSDELKNYN